MQGYRNVKGLFLDFDFVTCLVREKAESLAGCAPLAPALDPACSLIGHSPVQPLLPPLVQLRGA